MVIYAGRVAEQGPVAKVLGHPRHPYTAGLLAASPRHARRGMPLAAIPGLVPAPAERGAGCSFFGRCPRHLDRCATITPPLGSFADGRRRRVLESPYVSTLLEVEGLTKDYAARAVAPRCAPSTT